MENGVTSILLAGVGGQGIILASDIMADVFLEAGYDVKVARMSMDQVARALETDEPRGLVKAVVDRTTDRILGCAVIAVDGGELMAMLETTSAQNDSDAAPTDQQIGTTLRAIINIRGLRTRYFPSQIFADPAWDILLDLTRAKLDGQQVSVSSVCIAASVPMSTALRWVKQMTDAGLLLRWTDPKDRRRDLIALTETTAGHMRDYLAVVHKTLRAL